MICPKCQYPQHCGCVHCSERPTPDGTKRQILDHDKQIEICPNCGFGQCMDAWCDEEVKQLKEKGLW